MDEEQKNWYAQFSASFGAREFLRFFGFYILWIFSGVALALLLDIDATFFVFFFIPFGFALVAPGWKPAYSILKFLWGNKNMPKDPMPRSNQKISHKIKWGDYIVPFAFNLLILLLLIYTYFQLRSK